MEQVKKYLSEFALSAEQWFQDVTVAKRFFDFFSEFKKKETLENANWEDFQKMGDNINAFNSLALAKKNCFGKPNHPIEFYRNSFLYLVYGEDDLETRIRNFSNDKQCLSGKPENCQKFKKTGPDCLAVA